MLGLRLGLGLGLGLVYLTNPNPNQVCGALVQYPATDGSVLDYSGFAAKAKEAGAKLAVPTHLL